MALRSALQMLSSQTAAGSSTAVSAVACSSSRLMKSFFTSSGSSYAASGGDSGSIAGELGDSAAQKMSGGGQKAAGKTQGVEGRAADKGFVPQESNAVPDPDSAGQAGGVGAGAAGDMTDMVGAMFSGDAKRAGQDVADMTQTPEGGESHDSPAHSTAADWPTGTLQEGKIVDK